MPTTRVLLVDDNPAIRAAAARLLASRFDVIAAVSDGQSALEAFAKLAPDVVVMDISMPILNGIEAARILRKTHPAAKVIFFTVDGSADLQHVAMETGAPWVMCLRNVWALTWWKPSSWRWLAVNLCRLVRKRNEI